MWVYNIKILSYALLRRDTPALWGHWMLSCGNTKRHSCWDKLRESIKGTRELSLPKCFWWWWWWLHCLNIYNECTRLKKILFNSALRLNKYIDDYTNTAFKNLKMACETKSWLHWKKLEVLKKILVSVTTINIKLAFRVLKQIMREKHQTTSTACVKCSTGFGFRHHSKKCSQCTHTRARARARARRLYVYMSV